MQSFSQQQMPDIRTAPLTTSKDLGITAAQFKVSNSSYKDLRGSHNKISDELSYAGGFKAATISEDK
jgi:hypothetical protein